MKIIDLTMPIYHNMPVFPGDPEVEIEDIHSLSNEGWRLKSLKLTTHLGTHVNAPFHMLYTGKRLDEYPIDAFIADSMLFHNKYNFGKNNGVIFHDVNITKDMADQIVSRKPKFIGLSSDFEIDIEIEKYLLENDILSFENLINTNLLPSKFKFYGVPLSILNSDGSPVRAFAQC